MTIIKLNDNDSNFYMNRNDISLAIRNNDPLEEKLNVIIVISNPCLYKKRYELALDFIKRMEIDYYNEVNLFVVELAFKNENWYITDPNNPKHLQLRTNTAPLWHKENLINIGVKKLLPPDWKAFAWIDADIEFENITWARDTLKILNGSKDIVQLFSHCLDMDNDRENMTIFNSFGFKYCHKNHYKHNNTNVNYWHPGYAWAITRKAYDKLGGLYELSILGSGDNNIAQSFVFRGENSISNKNSKNYKHSVKEWERNTYHLRLGYVPGVIKHYFHGSKKNRKYKERWNILVKYQYDPYVHVKKNTDGLLIPTDSCPKDMLKDIMDYFFERKEDE